MTTQLNTGGLPQGQLLGRYRTYDDAQKVVDHLAKAENFDVKNLSIVGNDLRSVENIRSRLSYPRVAGAGAAQGAMFGFFIGLLLFLFAPDTAMVNMLFSVLLGMAIWMLIGVISYAVRRGRRDFASSSHLVATTYDVVCDFSVAGHARQLMRDVGVMSLTAANDPTGRSTALNGGAAQRPAAGQTNTAAPPSSATQQSTTAQQSPEGQPPAEGPQSQQRPASRGSAEYQPLADGRPRYGVRLADVKEQSVSEQSAQQKDHDAEQASTDASASENPASDHGNLSESEAEPSNSSSQDDQRDSSQS